MGSLKPVQIKSDEGITLDARELIRVLQQLDVRQFFNLIAEDYDDLHTEGNDTYDLIAEKIRNLGAEIEKMEDDIPG